MDKKDKFEINIEEAKEIIAKCIHPDYSNEEHELFKVAAAKLLDEKDPGFKYEYESEEEETSAEKSDESLFSRAKDYGKEIVNNVQSLGAAGTVAFSSAAYFQSIEAFDTTQEIGSVIRSVESDYGQSLMSYVGGIITEMIESTEEGTEEGTEESQSESNEESQSEEASSENKVEQSNPQNNEQREESENEESSIKTNSSETKSNIQTDSIQSETNGGGDIDAIDDIKPHSMIGDDAFEPVFTPHDAIVTSPAGPKL
jgi:hypothetical protein